MRGRRFWTTKYRTITHLDTAVSSAAWSGLFPVAELWSVIAAPRKAFNEFMHKPPRNGLTGTNYEYAVALWNDNNSSVTVSLSRDDEGNVFIPDYSGL